MPFLVEIGNHILSELRQHHIAHFIHISHNAVIAVVEDRSRSIRINSDELLCINTGDMVNRTGDAETDIQFGLDHNAGLAYLQFVRHKLTIHNRSCAGKLAAQKLCKLFVLGKALFLNGTAYADDRIAGRNVKLGVKLFRLMSEKQHTEDTSDRPYPTTK